MIVKSNVSHQNDYDTGVEKAVATAEERGYKVHRGEANVLTVDLDGDAMLNNAALALLTELYDAKIIGWWRSKDGRGRHFKIKLNKQFHPMQRGVMQAALGSDPKREILAIKLYRDAMERGSKGFEPYLLFQPTAMSAAQDREAF